MAADQPAERGKLAVELIDSDGTVGHIECLAVRCHEDEGEYWEPSPFAADLSDGRTPPWRRRVLGGGSDGEISARFASLDELAAEPSTPPSPAKASPEPKAASCSS